MTTAPANTATPAPISTDDRAAVEKLRAARDRVLVEVHKTIVGMDDVVDQMMVAIFARGHCLLEGVPGLAKTLLISSLAKTFGLSFKRIQFTPDLMPSDITGTEMLQDDPVSGKREFKFLKGPVFANVVLADEINRTPPKTQAALLEAMQEKRVSIAGVGHQLDEPFFVLATQNPLEQEGTYPLPEAQLDRFLFKIFVGYPSYDEEIQIMRRITSTGEGDPQATLEREEIIRLQALVRRVPVADHVFHYVAHLVRASRREESDAPDFIKRFVSYGAGPRACLNLITGAKARAVLHGRFHASVEDVQALALPVMRHRIGTNFAAQSENVSSEDVVRKLLAAVPADEKLYAAKAK